MSMIESGDGISAEQMPASASGICREKLILAALPAFVVGYLLLPGLAAAVFGDRHSAATGILAALGPFVSIIWVVLGVRCCSGSWRQTWECLDLHRLPGRRFLGWSFLLAVGCAIIAGAVTCLWGAVADMMNWQFAIPPTLEIVLSGERYQMAALFFNALLAAPVFEEILFRKALFEFLRKYLGCRGGTVLSALGFAAVHMSLLQLPGLFIFACIWQYFYCRSQSLWSSIILHFFNNLLAVCLLWCLRCYGGELTGY